MAVIEKSGLMKYKDESGNVYLLLPITSKDNVDGMEEIDAHLADTANPHGVTAAQVGADPAGTATTAVSSHNVAGDAHNDIRLLVEGLTSRLNALADSDDTTLDQLSEIVAYIKANKSLIDGVTTSKVNVTDIINNLTTNVSNKPLSAAQGVALAAMIEALTAADVGLGNVDNTSDADKPVSTAQATAIADAKKAGTDAQTNLTEHIADTENPHGVTAEQIGAAAEDHEHGYLQIAESEIAMPSTGSWMCVLYGNGVYVALPGGSAVGYYSTDGINWIETTLPVSATWRPIAYGNGKFVVAGANSSVAMYSEDGINWIETAMPSSAYWSSGAYGNGVFVAITDSGGVAAYSADGINWTAATLPASRTYKSVVYGNGKFVAVSALTSGYGAYSEDGINWAEMTLPTGVRWSSVTFGNGLFVVVSSGTSTSTAASTNAAYSEDGINWTLGVLPVETSWKAVAYGNGMFVAVSNSTAVAYSTDGINWSQGTGIPESGNWNIVTFGDGMFITLRSGAATIAYTTDGMNWRNSVDVIMQSESDMTDELRKMVCVTDDHINDLIDEKIEALSAPDLGLSTEDWTFTLEDGSTVTKAVYVG